MIECTVPSGESTGTSSRCLPEHLTGRSQPLEEGEVGRTATEKHVLAVVEGDAVSLDRRREAPEVRASLKQRDVDAGVGECERGRYTGETTSYHADSTRRHDRAATRLLIATPTFSSAGTETRPWVTATGLRSIRTSSRR